MINSLKILITTEQFPPTLSGIATVVSELALGLSALGHHVTIATKKVALRDTAIYPNLILKEFDIRGGFGNFYRGETDAYLQFVLTSDFDVIINECVQTWNSDLLFPYLSNIKAIKILHSHGFSLFRTKSRNPWANLKAKIYYRSLIKFLNHYDKVFILSSLSSEIPYFQHHHFTNYALLPNGVSSQLIASRPKELNETPVLLSISNFFPMKNQEFILRAFYLSQTKATMIFIGSSELHGYLGKLKTFKKRLDFDYGERDVHFYDALSRNETLEYLKRSTLFLHGSRLEAFPIVILEAMATGTPWICTDVGNVKELSGGMIISNETEMARTIDQLLSNQSHYAQLSDDALQLVKSRYNWLSIVKNLESMMSQISEVKCS